MTFLWNGALKELQLYSVPGLLVLRVTSEKNGNPLQYSCLENFMDWGAWWATIHGVAKSRTWPRDFAHCFQKKKQWRDTVLNKSQSFCSWTNTSFLACWKFFLIFRVWKKIDSDHFPHVHCFYSGEDLWSAYSFKFFARITTFTIFILFKCRNLANLS